MGLNDYLVMYVEHDVVAALIRPEDDDAEDVTGNALDDVLGELPAVGSDLLPLLRGLVRALVLDDVVVAPVAVVVLCAYRGTRIADDTPRRQSDEQHAPLVLDEDASVDVLCGVRPDGVDGSLLHGDIRRGARTRHIASRYRGSTASTASRFPSLPAR